MTEDRRELETNLLLIEIEQKDLQSEEEWNQWLEAKALDWEKEVESQSIAVLIAAQSLI